MRDQICKVIVHNVPEHAEEYIVARWSEDTHSLWYWGSWKDEADAEECARNVEGIVVRKVSDEG